MQTYWFPLNFYRLKYGKLNRFDSNFFIVLVKVIKMRDMKSMSKEFEVYFSQFWHQLLHSRIPMFTKLIEQVQDKICNLQQKNPLINFEVYPAFSTVKLRKRPPWNACQKRTKIYPTLPIDNFQCIKKKILIWDISTA